MSQQHCDRCGYLREYHQPDTLRCPADGGGYARTVGWRDSPPIDRSDWQTIIRRAAQAREAAHAAARAPYVPPPAQAPPLIAPRAPRGASELASYRGRQAVGLGRTAVAAGWSVAAFYWLCGDHSEGCAVKLRRDDLRAVATWRRAAGSIGKTSGWSADVAYGWRVGRMPIKVSHTDLESFLA